MARQTYFWSGRTALVTGASSGIGAATARLLAKHGLNVGIVARRSERLADLAEEIRQSGGKVGIFNFDLVDTDSRQELVRQTTQRFGKIDILVNNAGIGWYGYYRQMSVEQIHQMVSVNISAVAELTRLCLPGMHAQGYGQIINVGSIAGSLPSQGVTLYSASKSFLDAFTTALHRELTRGPVKVSVVRAGPVKSEFFSAAATQPNGRPIPAERFAISSERVAECIWRLIQRPRRVVYIPAVLRVTPWIEILMGWVIDQLGPLLLRKQADNRNQA